MYTVLKRPNPIVLLAVLLAVSLIASAFWVLLKDEPNVEAPTPPAEDAKTESPAGPAETESPVNSVDDLQVQNEAQHAEPWIPSHSDSRRYNDGDIKVTQDGPIRIERTAENCSMRDVGWQCDWRVEFINPYEDLDESELRGLADFDPWAGLMLAEAVKDRGATESELFNVLVQVVALLPSEDKGRGWLHMMNMLGKSAFGSPEMSDAELLEGYAWLFAATELGILSMTATIPIEQDLARRELDTEIGKEQATRIVSEVRSAFVKSGYNP